MNFFKNLVSEFQILKFLKEKIAFFGFMVFPWQLFKVSKKQFLRIVHTLFGYFFLAFIHLFFSFEAQDFFFRVIYLIMIHTQKIFFRLDRFCSPCVIKMPTRFLVNVMFFQFHLMFLHYLFMPQISSVSRIHKQCSSQKQIFVLPHIHIEMFFLLQSTHCKQGDTSNMQFFANL